MSIYAVLGVGGLTLFGLLRQSAPHTLSVIIAFMLIAFAVFYYFYYMYVPKVPKESETNAKALITREAKEPLAPKVEAGPVYDVHKYPKKGFGHLRMNKELEAIVHSVRVVRMFDRARYQELMLTLDQMQKTYMYVLGRRLPHTVGVPSFFDQRDRALELMYSFYLVTPRKLKHVYGVQPFERLQEAIERLFKATDTMTSVLRNFVRLELKQPWAYDAFVVPANRMSNPSTMP